MKLNHQILIIGGGTAGIMTAAQLLKKDKNLDIAIIEPSEKHFYQPAWTLVGAGDYKMNDTIKNTSDFIPKECKWIKDFVTKIETENNSITLKNGDTINYKFLIVASGLTYNLDLIEGLKEALDKKIACSNYIDAEETWRQLQNFKGGNAVFTQPITPIKCGGAPQKACYMSADYLQKKGLTSKSNIVLATPGSVIFGVKIVADSLMNVIKDYGIHFKPFYAPIKIDSENKKITFKYVDTTSNGCVITQNNILGEVLKNEELIEMSFDFLHLAPPQEPHQFVKDSGLCNAAGWLDVNHNTLLSNKVSNVFGLGDVAGLPTAKTGAAIRKQVPVVVDNLLKLIENKKADNNSYDGYSSCPLVVGYGKMILAEFNYKNEFTPDSKLKQMLVFDSYKPHWRLWLLKKYILPYLYWNKMLKGEKV